MITKERFAGIKKGDILIFSSNGFKPNTTRLVTKDARRVSVQIKRCNRITSRFNTTTYTYYDIAKRIIGIARKKQ